MKIVKTVAEYRQLTKDGSVGFVATLGALHEGHLSLIERCRAENDLVVLSIFVNPTQFGPNEDFAKYPRPFEKDVELAQRGGVDVIFAPEISEIYLESPVTVHVPVVTEHFDGKARPGHFDGVATIVAKLFNIVRPHRTYFGEKDLQQCAVIRKLIQDLNFDIELVVCETCRENTGLAMSSRNTYLSNEERGIAPNLYKALVNCKEQLLAGGSFSELQKETLNELEYLGFRPEYVELVNRNTMSPISATDASSSLIIAAYLGTTRLIDNIRVTG